MRLRKTFSLFAALSFCFGSVAAQTGLWRTYMAYHDIQQIEDTGSDLFVLASNGLYQYNLSDQSITTYDKVKQLSDNTISHIAWNKKAGRLIAVYSNANIDLIDLKGNVTNIASLYNKSMTADKTVDSITVDDRYAYLYARFGIVKVDMQRAEISDSYTPQHPLYPTSLPPVDHSAYNRYYELVKTLSPGGPHYNYMNALRFRNGRLYTCNGILRGNFDIGQNGTVQLWDGNEWTVGEDDIDSRTGHQYKDLAAVDSDPRDPNHLFACGRTGLYEFQDGAFVREYNYENSPLKATDLLDEPSKDYTLIEGLTFDDKGSLWVLNSGSNTVSLFELTADGQWVSHHQKGFLNSSGRSYDCMVNPMFDSQGHFWCCNARFIEACLIYYDPTTETTYAYKSFVNQDGTSLGTCYNVADVAEDKQGNIWVATELGPLMIEKSYIGRSPSEMVFTQVKVPRNDGSDYADYLLAGVKTTCIAIDNDGRKWFGTNGDGVYLISSDNMTEVAHYTAENSPLLSNIIGSIAIDPSTGEVFFGTDGGLCSYMSGVTHEISQMNSDDVYAYPNPVTPDYTGVITVTGLTDNADVKILTSSGKLVAEGRSSGRFFTWDGCDRNGKPVASGVYMVATATNDGKKGTVCKIAIIR